MKIKNKNIYLNKKLGILIKIIIVISFPFLTITLGSLHNPKDNFIGGVLSLLISLYLIFRKVKIEKINLYKLLFSLLSIEIINNIIWFGSSHVTIVNSILNKYFSLYLSDYNIRVLLGFLSLPSTTFIIYLFLDKIVPSIQSFIKSLTKVERTYLLIVLSFAIVATIILSNLTTAFTTPKVNDQLIFYDVIYTSDSGAIGGTNAFYNISNPENDLRQPLFGVFSYPFVVVAVLISKLCFFLPKDYSYTTIMLIFQFILLSITNILLSRLLKLKEKDKSLFLALLTLNFTYLLFSLIIEQYVIGLFYLILTIYCYYENPNKINYSYIGAVGTLLTSGIVFPLIQKIDIKNLKKYFKSVFICLLIFFIILIISGQFPTLLTIQERTNAYTSYIGKLSIMDRLNQFSHFISGIFIPNSGHIIMNNGVPSYWLNQFNSISLLGIIILIGCMISLYLNRESSIARISFFWICFSILILFIIGWGLQENGLVLYNLYFAWSYLILIYLLFKKLINKKLIFNITIFILIGIICLFSFNEILHIISFSIKYY